MLIQIYEISNAIEARSVSGAGVDHVGVLVGDGEFPRELSIENARPVLDAIASNCRKVILTLSHNLQNIGKIITQLEPDIIHLGTIPSRISVESIKALKTKFPFVKFMRSIPVTGEQSIRMALEYDQIADFLLLDSFKEDDKQVGATGLIHDWQISRKIVEAVRIPVILAGGLGSENVTEAIRQVRPTGVDSKTMTDKIGSHEKDFEKIKKFVEIIRQTERQL